jgi:O-antigen/teichoic acid export membrane protein
MSTSDGLRDSPAESPISNVARNTFINVAGAIAPIILSLATIPPYLHAIGEERYGVLAVVWVLFGYFGVFEFGLSRAAANQIAKMKDASAAQRSESSAAWLCCCLGNCSSRT